MTTKLTRQQRRALQRAKNKGQQLEVPASLGEIATNDAAETTPPAQEDTADTQNSPSSEIDSTDSEITWSGGWVSANDVIEIAGREIPGLVYVGIPPKTKIISGSKFNFSQFYIDPRLEIAEDVGDARITISPENFG